MSLVQCMAKYDHQHVAAKHTILRGVYEDNLDAGQHATAPVLPRLSNAARRPAAGVVVRWAWALGLFPMFVLAAYLLPTKPWPETDTHHRPVAIGSAVLVAGDPPGSSPPSQMRGGHDAAQTRWIDVLPGADILAQEHSTASSLEIDHPSPSDVVIPVNGLASPDAPFERAYGSTETAIDGLSPSVFTELDEAVFAEAIGTHGSPQDYTGLIGVSEIPIAGLFGLRAKRIIIDPGHGGRDPGARGRSGLQEKAVTLDVAKRLAARLKRRGDYRVLLVRKDDRRLSLKKRVDFANRNAGDLFVSIHVNYLAAVPDTVIETYYFGPHADEESLRLAAKENQDSQFTMGGFNDVIKKLGHTFKHQESKALAVAIQKNLIRNIRLHNREVIDVGIKTAPFAVLLGVDMPSVLAEVTCLSNEHEEERLATPEYREEIARYLEDGIVEYLDHRQPNVETILGARRYVRNESKEAG